LADPQPTRPAKGRADVPRDTRAQDSGNAATLALRRKLVRNLDELVLQREHRAPRYDSVCGRLSTGTAADKLGAGYDSLAPGQRVCFHPFHHAQEEMFVILEGQGSLRVTDKWLPPRVGDVVFIPSGPDDPHQIINTSDAPMRSLSISTQERPEVCEYPDSGKLSVTGGGVYRAEAGVDYWHGES
jgi:uncharacterized cupin superfamily protein